MPVIVKDRYDSLVVAAIIGSSFYVWLRPQLIIDLAFALVLLVVLGILVVAAGRDTIDIEPITVPKDLADEGYTPIVAAERLYDAIRRVVGKAGTSMEHPRFSPRGPDIVIHDVWMKPEVIASWVGIHLRLRRRQAVSGEITLDDGRLRLRVVFNDRILYQDSVKVDMSRPDTGLLEALDVKFNGIALQILELTNPYFVASACYPSDLATAGAIADRIIATLPKENPNVARAYDLRGLIHYYNENDIDLPKKDYRAAKDVFKFGIKNFPDLIVNYQNLGEVLMEEGDRLRQQGYTLQGRPRYKAAKTILAKAIERDPCHAGAYYDLGEAMRRLNDPEAVSQFRKAIRLSRTDVERDPNNMRAYRRIAIALQSLSKICFEEGKRLRAEGSVRDAEAKIYRAEDKLNLSLAAIRRAVQLDTDNESTRWEYVRILGDVAAIMGKDRFKPLVQEAKEQVCVLYRLDRDYPGYTAPEFVEATDNLQRAGVDDLPPPPNSIDTGHGAPDRPSAQ